MTDLSISGILLGGLLAVIFVGYVILSFSEGSSTKRVPSPQKFAGSFALLLGLILLGFWIYFMFTGRESFMRSFGELVVHVALELVSSLALLIAGIGMLRGWSRGPALMMIAVGILLFTTVLSLFVYGPVGHPMLMNGVAIVAVIVAAYFVGLVYAWEHFVLRLDRTEDASREDGDKRVAS